MEAVGVPGLLESDCTIVEEDDKTNGLVRAEDWTYAREETDDEDVFVDVEGDGEEADVKQVRLGSTIQTPRKIQSSRTNCSPVGSNGVADAAACSRVTSDLRGRTRCGNDKSLSGGHKKTTGKATPARFTCNFCLEQFTSKFYFKHHVFTHIDNSKHICSLCGQVLPTAVQLRKHIVGNHKGDEGASWALRVAEVDQIVGRTRDGADSSLYTCAICDKSFSSLTLLSSHSDTHGVKPAVKCVICDKFFKNSDTLYRHMIVHTKPDPRVCGDCGRSFPTPALLKEHKLAHTDTTGLSCQLCGKYFSKKFSLKKHLCTHVQKYLCDVCGESFHLASGLEIHKYLHAGKQIISSRRKVPV